MSPDERKESLGLMKEPTSRDEESQTIGGLDLTSQG